VLALKLMLTTKLNEEDDMLVAFDSLGVVQVLDPSLARLVGGGGSIPVPGLPDVHDSTTNYVCAHNLGCMYINNFCASNVICDTRY
jgi:hypothetical protein